MRSSAWIWARFEISGAHDGAETGGSNLFQRRGLIPRLANVDAPFQKQVLDDARRQRVADRRF